ncbi:MAG: HlyC/CorC family transporter [Myxococcales bacterium FL481]|nr:MAG: HlyC/CorC family transporter [Myxococcales bacterium FL481]
MDDADKLSVLVGVLCLVGSMFFSASETAITSYDQRRAARLVEEGGPQGKALRQWVEQPVTVLSAILLGNNVVNTLLTATATALAIRQLEGGVHDEYAVPVAVVAVTGLLLVFGEILPKALGRVYWKTLSVPMLRVLHVFGRLTLPVTWLLAKITDSIVSRATAGEANGAGPAGITSGELGYLVRQAEREGTIRSDQAAMLQGVFRFEAKTVRDIMVPLDRVTAVDMSWDLEQITRVAMASGHSRLPVYVRDVDNVRGVLHIKQLVGLSATEPGEDTLQRIMRMPVFVSESLLIHDLLRRFKEQRVHLAIVVDDAGDAVGVVTLEDVLEQIVGEIFDESDRLPAVSPAERFGIFYLDGQDSLARVEEVLDVEFDEIDGVDSIGDLLCRLAGQTPIAGSVFVWENVRFKVLAADARHIIRVSIEVVELGDEEDD